MTKKAPARKGLGQASGRRHQHRPGNCLNILRQLSAYIDDELPSDICRELRRHLGACPNCEVFIASLRQTVTLCRHSRTPQLSAKDRIALRQKILRTAQS
jgi:anti-sigma factor RsiW